MEQHHVSKEALQGPQGPAPRPAEEFENGLSKLPKDAEAEKSGRFSFDMVIRRVCCGGLANMVSLSSWRQGW